MIEVKDVHKRFHSGRGVSKWVLRGINLTIPPHCSVGLIGANGAGKSTLLRLIGGIDTPTKGEVIRGCRMSWPLGLVSGLQGSLSGRQNSKFVFRLHGAVSGPEISERIEFVREFSELGEAFENPINTYSTGMQARLRFALSLCFDFEVYLVDELTAVGDAAFIRKSKQAFKSIADRAGLIMVSHSEQILRDYCDAGIWLHQGQAQWFDRIEDALSAYKESIRV